MNLNIVVRPGNNGRFIVDCPNFPNCSSEGFTLEEALDHMIEKISGMVADNIRRDLKESVKDLPSRISPSGNVDIPLMMTKLPISLN